MHEKPFHFNCSGNTIIYDQQTSSVFYIIYGVFFHIFYHHLWNSSLNGLWLTPAFVAVCAQAEPLTLAEARRMSVNDVARIYEARERARGSSTPVAAEAAQDAVACVFGDTMDVAASTTDVPISVSSPIFSPITTSMPAPAELEKTTETVLAEEALGESLPSSPAEDVDHVDDGLMDALAAWSRLSNLSDRYSYGPSPSSWPSYSPYQEYRVDYEVVLNYGKGGRLQSTSLQRLLSAMLQSDLYSGRPGPCAQLWKDIHTIANDDVQDGSNDMKT